MQRKRLTPAVINQRPPDSGRIEIRDSLSPLTLRISAHGGRSFIVRTRIKGASQPIRLTYDAPAHASALEEARRWAVDAVSACRRGDDPRAAKAQSARAQQIRAELAARNRFDAVAERFLEKHASKNRCYKENVRIVKFYLLPGWRDRDISDIRRPDIVARLDDIETGRFRGANGNFYGGPVMADRVLAQLRKLMNWHAARDPDFVSPIVRGMARTKPRERTRTRVLSDDEIRLIWRCLEGNYGDVLKVLFLTAQRVGEVAQMRRTQIDHDGLWTIPSEAFKGKRPQFVPLSATALEIISRQPVIDGSDLVFGAERNPHRRITNWSALKKRLDARITLENDGAALPHWTQHDIRRTCRTLMSRAGIRPDISERVLGHVISGVEGVYDRYAYIEEKGAALDALAALLTRILDPAPAEIVPFVQRSAS